MARQQQNMMLWALLGIGAIWAFSQRRPAGRIPVAAPGDIYSAAPRAPSPEEIYEFGGYPTGRAPYPGTMRTEPYALPGETMPPAEEAVVWPTEGARIPGYPEPSIIVESPFAANGYRWW